MEPDRFDQFTKSTSTPTQSRNDLKSQTRRQSLNRSQKILSQHEVNAIKIKDADHEVLQSNEEEKKKHERVTAIPQ